MIWMQAPGCYLNDFTRSNVPVACGEVLTSC
jgi:hypothetical protein